MRIKLCCFCGVEIIRRRSDKKFCSAKCRWKKNSANFWPSANPERKREYYLRWKTKNTESYQLGLETKRQWSKKNRQKANLAQRRWKEVNPERVKEQNRRKRNKHALMVAVYRELTGTMDQLKIGASK